MPLPRRRSTRTNRPPSSPRPLRSRLWASRRNSRSGRSMGSSRVQSKLPSPDTELSSSSLRSARLRRCSTSQLPSTRQDGVPTWNRRPAAPRHSGGTTPPRASARRAGDGTRHPPPPPGRRPVPARRRARRSSVAVSGGRRRAARNARVLGKRSTRSSNSSGGCGSGGSDGRWRCRSDGRSSSRCGSSAAAGSGSRPACRKAASSSGRGRFSAGDRQSRVPSDRRWRRARWFAAGSASPRSSARAS